MDGIVEKFVQDRSASDTFIVFIHGYNNTSEKANEAVTTLDISWDSKQSGRIVSLMFDGDGTSTIYPWSFLAGWNNAMKSVEYLRRFILLMHLHKCTNIVFVAHSLGNLVLVKTVEKMAKEDGNEIFRNCQFISFASACLTEQLEEAINAMGDNFKRWTSYFHCGDWALKIESIVNHCSKRVNKEGRSVMGNKAIYLRNNKFECVDCSMIELESMFSMNHSYFLHPSVLLDVGISILNGKSAQERELKDGKHWQIKKEDRQNATAKFEQFRKRERTKFDRKKAATLTTARDGNYDGKEEEEEEEDVIGGTNKDNDEGPYSGIRTYTKTMPRARKDIIEFKNPIIVIVGIFDGSIKEVVKADISKFESFCTSTLGYNKEKHISIISRKMFTSNKEFENKFDDCVGNLLVKLNFEADSVLFYYSGHGGCKDGKEDVLYVSSDSLPVRNIYNRFKSKIFLKNKPIIMINDACRGGDLSFLINGNNEASTSQQVNQSDNKEDDIHGMTRASEYFKLEKNSMIVSSNTAGNVSYAKRDGNGFTDWLIKSLEHETKDLRFQVVDIRDRVEQAYDRVDGGIVSQMVELRETMEKPVYIGRDARAIYHETKDEKRFELENPLVIIIGDLQNDLESMRQLFGGSDKLGYPNVAVMDKDKFDKVPYFEKFLLEQKGKLNKGIDGLVVVYSGEKYYKTARLFNSIYKTFDGKNCEYLRGKPKIYILNKYGGKIKSVLVDGERYYHRDENVLILHNECNRDDDCTRSPFLIKFDQIISSDKHRKERCLREIACDIRILKEQRESKGCLEMIETMSHPVKLFKHDKLQRE